MTAERDAYAVLRVHSRVSRDEISRAYRALARRFHPDGASQSPQLMAEVNRAYDRVKTPEARARYDTERVGGVPVGPGHSPSARDASRWTGGIGARIAAREDATVVDFGRYAGWRIVDLARTDPGYLRWLSRHSSGIRYRDVIQRSLPGDDQVGRGSKVLG